MADYFKCYDKSLRFLLLLFCFAFSSSSGEIYFFGRTCTDLMSLYHPRDGLASANKLADSPKWRACSQALIDGSSYLGGKGEIKTRFPPFGIK